VLLLLLAVVLFIMDVTSPSHGVLTAGGLISLVTGSLLLFRPGNVYVHLSLALIFTVTGVTALVMFFALRAGWRAQHLPAVVDQTAVVGRLGETVTDLSPSGVVRAGSGQWRAIADEGPIAKGSAVRVVGRDGLRLHVRAAEHEGHAPEV